jgi:N-methylhydantoinase A/oxoprolinase/acetone carboxylase beta subunit
VSAAEGAALTPGEPTRDLRIGIDVGGTNTDAVVLDAADAVLAWTKQPTTDDVTGGMRAALAAVLAEIDEPQRVGRVMLGTTAVTNAIVERRRLGKVAVLRLGAPATTSVPPLATWPTDLRAAISAGELLTGGGHLVDGRQISPLDTEAIVRFLEPLVGQVDAVAVTGVFSPVIHDQEREVGELARSILGPDVAISLSHEIGQIGLLERENSTVLNAALHDVARDVTGALGQVLTERGLTPGTFFAQNDGTLMALDAASRYPVLTIGSGPANSIRGAAFLSGYQDAIVADVGGTTTDFGVLVNGLPRESTAPVVIGGVATNFRMPDVLAIGLGGGTLVHDEGGRTLIGPQSVGHRLTTQALIFGGTTPTLTDAGVHAGRARFGSAPVPAELTAQLARGLITADEMFAEAVDLMSFGKSAQPLVVVGGGAFLAPAQLVGVAEVIRPERGSVANAVGAAIALASGRWDVIVPADERRREAIEQACAMARDRAVQAGADPADVEVVDLVEIPLSYLPEPASRVTVKAAGPLAAL